MLNKIRKGADTLFVRIILGLIAVSFLGFGAAEFLNGNSRGNIVTFSDAESISVEEFMLVKSREIETIQRENGINLTEEQISDKNFDRAILQGLIRESMLSYLAKYYDFDISDTRVVGFVQKFPHFKNANGEFDLNIFKSSFRTKRQEEEYLNHIKKGLIVDVTKDSFMRSFVPAGIMLDNIVDYMAETRSIDLFSISLENRPADFLMQKADDKVLEDLYKKNEDQFILPETRSFSHSVISKSDMNKRISISDKELKEYYENNKDDFSSADFKSAEKEVRDVLKAIKMEEVASDLTKKLESDISSGMTLKEIAGKHKLQINQQKELSLPQLKNVKDGGFAEMADAIFEMSDKELSYPIENPETGDILLVEISSITPARTRSYAEVKDQVENMWLKLQLAEVNSKAIAEVNQNFDSAKFSPQELKSRGIMSQDKSIMRQMVPSDDFPPALHNAIMQTQIGKTTPVVRFGDKLYFAHVKSSHIDKKEAQKIKNSPTTQITTVVKEGIMQEIIGHLTEINKMKVNLD